MKTWKRILAVFLVLMIFIFTTSICEREAEASVATTVITVAGAVVTAYELVKIHQEAYESYNSGSWKKVQDWAIKNFGPIGFIMTVNPEAELIDRVLKPFLQQQGIIDGNDSDQEAFDKWSSYVNNHYHLENDGTITYDESMKNIFNGLINAYTNESGFRYVYTFNIINHATEFASGDAYQITRDFIQTYQPEGKVCAYSNYYRKIMLADLSNCAFVRTSDISDRYEVTPYNLDTWEAVMGYEYSFDGTQYTATGASGNQMRAQVKVAPTQTGELGLWSWCTSGKNNVYKMYMSLADLKADSVGQAPYYINNSVYNDWSTSTGDYTVNTDNSNHATYGDITSYIDSFNTEYGRYPSDTDIFKWIENYDPTVNPTPTPGPDNPSGGGSFVNNNNPSITNNPTFNNNPNINITLFPSVCKCQAEFNIVR